MTDWRRLERPEVVRQHDEIVSTYKNGGLQYKEPSLDSSGPVDKYYEPVLHVSGGSWVPGGVKYYAFICQKEGNGVAVFKLYSNKNFPLTIEDTVSMSLSVDRAKHVKKSTGNRQKALANGRLPEDANAAIRKFWDKISSWLEHAG